MEETPQIPEGFSSSEPPHPTLRSRLGNALRRSAQAFLTGLRTAHVEVVALLIDGENSSPEMITAVLAEAGKFGGVTIRRIYGNTAAPTMQRWRKVMTHYCLQAMHQTPLVPGKNAADIALAVDAMDLLYREQITRFCLVASDSDYTPLVLRLRAAGCLVIGIGDARSPLPLVKACSVFLFTDQLVPPSSKGKASSKKANDLPVSPASPSPMISAPTIPQAATGQTTAVSPETMQKPEELAALLKEAYLTAIRGKKTEWVLVAQVGTALRQIDPLFKPSSYGQKDLSSLLKQHEELFEIRKRSPSGHLEVRLRTPVR